MRTGFASGPCGIERGQFATRRRFIALAKVRETLAIFPTTRLLALSSAPHRMTGRLSRMRRLPRHRMDFFKKYRVIRRELRGANLVGGRFRKCGIQETVRQTPPAPRSMKAGFGRICRMEAPVLKP